MMCSPPDDLVALAAKSKLSALMKISYPCRAVKQGLETFQKDDFTTPLQRRRKRASGIKIGSAATA
jgi:hypothetical protein